MFLGDVASTCKGNESNESKDHILNSVIARRRHFADCGNLGAFITLCIAILTFFVLFAIFSCGCFLIGYPFPIMVAGSRNFGAFVTLCTTITLFVLFTCFTAGCFLFGYSSTEGVLKCRKLTFLNPATSISGLLWS